MSVYLIVEYRSIEDENQYFDYIKKAEPIVKKYSGQYITRTDKIKFLSGDWKPKRIVIIKFPSAQMLGKCFNSEEYKAIKPLRNDSAQSKAIVVDEYID